MSITTTMIFKLKYQMVSITIFNHYMNKEYPEKAKKEEQKIKLYRCLSSSSHEKMKRSGQQKMYRISQNF